MKQNHAINLLLIFITLNSCSLGKNSLKNEAYNIINKEINRNIYQNNNETPKKMYLDFVLDKALKGFVKNQQDDNPYALDLKEKIDDAVYESIFNTKEVNNFIEQLNSKIIDNKKIALPRNVFHNTNKDTGNNAVDKLLGSTKFRINLSIPVFTSDNKYCLIAFSNGFENSMSGGINIYVKEKNNWKYYTSFNEWIE